MGADLLPSILQTGHMELNLEADGSSYLFKGSSSEVSERTLAQVAAAVRASGAATKYKVDMVEPSKFAKLTEEERKMLAESVKGGSRRGLAFIALQLGLAEYEDLGLKKPR